MRKKVLSAAEHLVIASIYRMSLRLQIEEFETKTHKILKKVPL